jgi:FkbM family methyltransferase
MDRLYWKHLLIRTPIERPARKLQHIAAYWRVLRHPGIREVYLEGDRIDRALGQIIKRDSNCVDIGAHLGSTLSLLLELAPGGRHMAFEPIARKAGWLQKKFPEVDVRAAALGNVTGKVTFSENLSRPGFSGLRAPTDVKDRVREVEVQGDRLDAVLSPGYRVDFLKVDVEGAELKVLQGAAETLKRDRPTILFESGPGGAEKFGLSRRDLFSYLNDEQGYSIYFIKDFLAGAGPIDLDTFDAGHNYPFRAFNYLAIDADRSTATADSRAT